MKGFEIIDSSNIMYAGKHYQKVLADDRSKPQCNRCVFNTDPNEVDEVCLEIGNSNCDCANGEYWIEDTMEIQIPEGCEVEKVSTGEGKVVVKFKAKELKYPRTWEGFCKCNAIVKGESKIRTDGDIVEYKYSGDKRFIDNDINVLPNRETAEAVLALCQLIQLRECYNQRWKPDWNNFKQEKYVIDLCQNEFDTGNVIGLGSILHFKSEELRDLFLENFRDLIEKLKPLYGIMKGGTK